MSKKSRTESRKRRLREKRQRKESNRLKYAAWRAQGENTKSKRYAKRTKNSSRLGTKKGLHPQLPCGNLACNKCHKDYPPN